jgi:hypothetical protein
MRPIFLFFISRILPNFIAPEVFLGGSEAFLAATFLQTPMWDAASFYFLYMNMFFQTKVSDSSTEYFLSMHMKNEHLNLIRTWIIGNKSDGDPPKIWDEHSVLHWWIHMVVPGPILHWIIIAKPLCKHDHVMPV